LRDCFKEEVVVAAKATREEARERVMAADGLATLAASRGMGTG